MTRRLATLSMVLAALPAGAWAEVRRPPKTPPPAERVEPCPEMGTGFVRIPGTPSCVALDGSIRVEGMVRR